ncbi:polysaccharide deacetylase family protein [Paenibacillus sp. MMS18-CY102]|uniref:polysaccharide deacetylase family protein n=1 Tax=Paenibacillus sp. MMS18-CY102 TaxID=2682849 RepID=UPI001365D109|nr:polysaccharide deacetylase family protein [Paenibacillus sp. MMS18-CY102]MWC26516.1 polysaccharide deacetylase family protein [Paenibacillus sp. MMS18-CY102]
MKYGKTIAMAGCMLAVVLLANANGSMNRYIASIKASSSTAEAAYGISENDRLLASIHEEAAKRRIAPVDAVVDRVWKAIPGYNGVEVDVNRTYQANLGNAPGAPLQLIYKQIQPKVGLDDLGVEPTYRGNPNKKMVSIMINVAWGNEYIGAILKTLDDYKVKATFFLDGSWLKRNPELAKEIQSHGHEMSNHAYSHPKMSQLSRDAQYQQIVKTESLLQSTLGVKNRWFAPPSGDFNTNTVKVAHSQGLRTVLWTIDTIDWMKPAPSTIVSRIRSKLAPGSLILMHPTASSRDALADMIKVIQAKGYQIGTVSQTLSSDRIDANG